MLYFFFSTNNIRIKYLGRNERGRVDIRIGGHPGLEIGVSQMAWGMQLDKIPLAPKVVDSSNTIGMVSVVVCVHIFLLLSFRWLTQTLQANVFVGDITTEWISNPAMSGPQWLEFDLRDPHLITQFSIVVDGTTHTPASVALQWYYESGERWISVGGPVFLERVEGE